MLIIIIIPSIFGRQRLPRPQLNLFLHDFVHLPYEEYNTDYAEDDYRTFVHYVHYCHVGFYVEPGARDPRFRGRLGDVKGCDLQLRDYTL